MFVIACVIYMYVSLAVLLCMLFNVFSQQLCVLLRMCVSLDRLVDIFLSVLLCVLLCAILSVTMYYCVLL